MLNAIIATNLAIKSNECWNKKKDDKSETSFIHKNESDEKYTCETLLLTCENNQNDDIWYLDSGVSKHMIGNKNLFSKLMESEFGQVKIGDARTFAIKGIGIITIEAMIGKLKKCLKFIMFQVCKVTCQVLGIF